MENKTPYFVQAARELCESVIEYLSNTKYNYVIVEGITPVVWDGCTPNIPVVFGSMQDAFEEMGNWAKVENVSIITEEQYIKTYLGDAWDRYYKSNDYVMNTTNGHDKALVHSINELWAKDYNKFRPILTALYRRDVEECLNADGFTWDADANAEFVFMEMCTHWEAYAHDYLQHIADDQDLQCILDFLHY